LALKHAAKVDAETTVDAVQREAEGSKEGARVQVLRNERAAEVAEANTELAMMKARWERQAMVAEVESAKAVAIRDAQLQAEVERTMAERQTEKLKLSKAVVDYEMKVQQANCELSNREKALLFEQKKQAEARGAVADADFFARHREAKRKEAPP
jgi:flotillin